MSRSTRLLLVLSAAAVTVAACGSDGNPSAAGDAADPSAMAGDATTSAGSGGGSSESTGEERDAGLGGVGHWTAAQLCSLVDLPTASAMFTGSSVVETTGIDDADWSSCSWDDADGDPLAPESTLYRISNRDFGGGELCDCFEAIDIPGTDQAVFDEDIMAVGRPGILAVVGDQILEIEYQSSAAGGREVAELAATTWAMMQAG